MGHMKNNVNQQFNTNYREPPAIGMLIAYNIDSSIQRQFMAQIGDSKH